MVTNDRSTLQKGALVSDSASEAVTATGTPPIRLACVEVCNFRRLAKTRLEVDKDTTILVGANNSGKTSLLTVLAIS